MRGTFGKLAILTCLYLAQGLPYGFFKQALPVMMRDRGASLPDIGLVSLLALPWALKFLWAPLVDRFGFSRFGVRKTWLVALQVIGIGLFLYLGMIENQTGYAYLVWGFFFANLIAATQDIATDGIAVNMLNDNERGFGNGLQVAGYRVGMIVGGGFLLTAFSFFQWRGSFLFIGAAILLTTLPVLFYKEPPSRPHDAHIPPHRLLTRLFRRKEMMIWVGVIAFYKFGDAMASHMLTPFFRDRGLTIQEIGSLLGYAGFIGGLLGALVGGFLVRPLGRYRALLWLGVIQALAVFGYWMLAQGMIGDGSLKFLCFTEHFTGGMATAAAFTAMMDVCDPQSGSTDYTLQASLVVVSTGLAGVLSGFVAGSLGYSANFLMATLLSLGGALIFAGVYRHTSGSREALQLNPQPA